MTKNGTRRRFSICLGLPRSSSNPAVGRGAEIAKTFRFCGFRIWWRFWGALFFCKKKKGLPKVTKNFNFEKRCQIEFFEPCFGPFLAPRFWGWVFLRCRARLWAPYNALPQFPGGSWPTRSNPATRNPEK